MKVFCLGFHKTGTRSFAALASELGLRVLHDTRHSRLQLWPDEDGVIAEGSGEAVDIASRVQVDRLDALVDAYDVLTDNPWPLLYRLLDQRYPGSKFVHIVRDTDAWIDSVCSHFGARNSLMRLWIYGYGNPLHHAARYREVYDRHNAAVAAYFTGRDDFFSFRLEDSAGVAPALSAFLGFEYAKGDFPHLGTREKRAEWMARRAGNEKTRT
jgi:hypothetical protein